MNSQGWIVLGVGLFGVLSAVLTQVLLFGRFEGRVMERLDNSVAAQEKFEREQREDQNDQWSNISGLRERVAYVEAKVNGKPNGKGAHV